MPTTDPTHRARIADDGRPASRLTLGVDFHGVICAHPEGSQDRTQPDWPEVPGAIEWLKAITDRYDVHLVSARFSPLRGDPRAAIGAARDWLLFRGVPRPYFYSSDGPPRITLTPYKPACVLWVDDRGWRFDGTFPTAGQIESFRPWNRS